jgi:hypothetical protein
MLVHPVIHSYEISLRLLHRKHQPVLVPDLSGSHGRKLFRIKCGQSQPQQRLSQSGLGFGWGAPG